MATRQAIETGEKAHQPRPNILERVSAQLGNIEDKSANMLGLRKTSGDLEKGFRITTTNGSENIENGIHVITRHGDDLFTVDIEGAIGDTRSDVFVRRRKKVWPQPGSATLEVWHASVSATGELYDVGYVPHANGGENLSEQKFWEEYIESVVDTDATQDYAERLMAYRRKYSRVTLNWLSEEAESQPLVPQQIESILPQVSLDHLLFDERTLAQHVLIRAMEKMLNSADAIQITADPTMGRTGQERFVVVDSKDGNTHILIENDTPGEDNPDSATAIWIDESTMRAGEIEFVEGLDIQPTRNIQTTADAESLTHFIETGGMDYIASGNGLNSGMSQIEIMAFAQTIREGHVNVELTTAALKELEAAWGAQRV